MTNDVTAGTQVQHIGSYAFYNTPITTLSLPSTTTFIGDRAMAGMVNLQQLTSDAAEVPELGEEVWLGVKQATIPLKVPYDSYNAYSTANQWSRFLVWTDEQQSVFGDVNQDGDVTAADITALYDILLGNSTNFMETADVNGDGEVTAADITCVYNVLLGIENAPGRNKKTHDSSDIIAANAFIIEPGKSHTMDVEMRNNAQFAAMQLDITMPQGLTIEDVTTTSRASHMNMGFNEIEPGKWRILIHSATTTSGNDGTLLNISVKADESFTAANNPTIASHIERINQKFLDEGKNYVLIGPGRWGSSDYWLGIPVKWPHISAARVIVEAGLKNYHVDPSQGTHFFQNLTSFGVGYFTINTYTGDGIYQQDVLDRMPAIEETAYVRHVRFERPLKIMMDGKKQIGVVLFPTDGVDEAAL